MNIECKFNNLPPEICSEILSYLPEKKRLALRTLSHDMQTVVDAALTSPKSDFIITGQKATEYKNKLKEFKKAQKKAKMIAKCKKAGKHCLQSAALATLPVTVTTLAALTLLGIPVSMALSVLTFVPCRDESSTSTDKPTPFEKKLVSMPVTLPANAIEKLLKFSFSQIK